MLKAVLFDLDDTLIDWREVEGWTTRERERLHRVFNFVHNDICPLTDIDADGFMELYHQGLDRAWEEGVQTLRSPDMLDVLAKTVVACGVPEERLDRDALMASYDWQAPPGLRTFPDVPDALRQLHSHGVQLGIVTNAAMSMRFRDRELQAVGILDLFSPCRLAAVDTGYLKPHRGIFDRALELVGASADEAVFVGDNLDADVAGAQGAGMRGVLRVHDPARIFEDNGTVPDGEISTLHDLLPLLDAWYPGWRNGHTPS